MRRTIEIVARDERGTAWYDLTFIEDAALILLQQMERQGYLRPVVDVRATTIGGESFRLRWPEDGAIRLPRDTEFRRIRFRMIPGRIYYYDRFTAPGLIGADGETVMTGDAIQRFFFPSGFLFRPRRMRPFTERRFRQSADNLREALRREGFRDAQVAARVIGKNDATGAVHAVVEIDSGPRYWIRNLIIRVATPDPDEAVADTVIPLMTPWSRIWEQDTAVKLRNDLQARGYADARCTIDPLPVEDDEIRGPADERMIDAVARLLPGPYVQAGAIRFEGHDHTVERVMRRRLQIKPGDPLDPVKVERSRQRLAAMGSFERVSVDYRAADLPPIPPSAVTDPAAAATAAEAGPPPALLAADPATREIIFRVEEGQRFEVSLLAGYGSYELLRGGIEIEQRNLWGRGHRSRTRLLQSFKSSEADYVYTVPELLAERISGFSRLSALRRSELDFLRRELGISSGLRRSLPAINAALSVLYTYELLRSDRFESARDIGRPESSVGSLTIDFRFENRDNPVYPKRGGQAYTRTTLAAKALGGDAEYLSWEMGGALHAPLGGGRVWHGGLNQGVVKSLGDQRNKLPFNRRFFPGGDRSQRGFRHGQAASVNAAGQRVGSETYLLMQHEIEQALTPALNLLFFCDTLRIGENIERWPEGDWLLTVGAGLRYRTIVGPLRIEYGHNLQRRDVDPRGMLHLSVGFPF